MALLPPASTKRAQPFLFSRLPITVTSLVLPSRALPLVRQTVLTTSFRNQVPREEQAGSAMGDTQTDPWSLGRLQPGSLIVFEPQFTLYTTRSEWLRNSSRTRGEFLRLWPKVSPSASPPPRGCLLKMQLHWLHRELLHHNLKERGWEASGLLTSSSGDLDDHGV